MASLSISWNDWVENDGEIKPKGAASLSGIQLHL
jgi:hypothetical protein